MALRLSTGLRNDLLSKRATVVACGVGITFALVGGSGSGAATITDSDDSFIDKGFRPGQVLFLQGATTGANDAAVSGEVIQSVAIGTLTLLNTATYTAETFAAGTVLAAARGGSYRDLFDHGVLNIYSGSQPTSPDNAASGTLLLTITVSSGAFVAGAFANGLLLGDAASGSVSKATGQVWSAAAAASGTAGWWRFVGNATDNGALSTTLPRLDGNVGSSGADLNMASTTITAAQTYTLDTFTLTQPQFYGA